MRLDRHPLDRAEQVEHLRRKIAAVSGRVSRGHSTPPRIEDQELIDRIDGAPHGDGYGITN